MKFFLKSLLAIVIATLSLSTVSFAASYNSGRVGVTYSDESAVALNGENDMLTVMVVKSDTNLSDINSDSILYLDHLKPVHMQCM